MYNALRADALMESTSGTASHEELRTDTALADLHEPRDEPSAPLAAEQVDEDEDEEFPMNPVFSLPALLLDSSAALQAAQRMYASSQSGLRFFSDFRRVVPTSQLRAEQQREELGDDDDFEILEAH